MKKRLLSLAMAFAIGVTGSVGFSSVVNAANTKDATFSFYNGNKSTTTKWRSKTDTSKVYVYPKEGPSVYFTVRARKSSSDNDPLDASRRFFVPCGVKGSLTNWVLENGGSQARLYIERRATAYVTTSGVWSPDSTKNYTIYK